MNMKTAAQILERIAPCHSAFIVGDYSGYIEKRHANSVDLVWEGEEYTINAHGVVCSRAWRTDGTWYGYTLDPFGPDVGFADTNEIARAILKGN
jgi:hypothetical protein